MTYAEFCEIKNRIYRGLTMVVEKGEIIGREKKEYSLQELGEMSDIVKDSAESLKDIAKAHYYMQEHSIEKY